MVTATGPAPGSEMKGAGAHVRPHRNTCGALSMPAIFGDGMVLQRGTPIAVFGTLDMPGNAAPNGVTAPGDAVTVRLVDADGAVVAQASSSVDPSNGRWSAQLPSLPASGPFDLLVESGESRLRFTDVYVGVVWLAGGQSNMEVELRNSDGAEQAIAQCADPLLRFRNVPKTGVVDEEAENDAVWQASSPQTSGVMSAVAYYFARKLRAELGPDIAVGVVDCYIGGTSITCWMSRDVLEGCAAGRGYLDRYDQAIAGRSDEELHAAANAWQSRFDAWNAAIAAAQQADPDITWDTLNAQYGACPWPPPVTPFSQWHICGAFEAMVRRVAPYTIEGVLWYQGEEDEPYCESYRELLGLMIEQWRGLWHDADLPFLLVQLPQWIDGKVDKTSGDPMLWPTIRAAQWDAAHTIGGVHAVCLMDCGEYDNIHPTDKRTPGERLADCALRRVYGRSDVTDCGPEALEARPSGNGGAEIRFANASGLRFDGTDPASRRDAARRERENAAGPTREAGASGFELAGIDGIFHPASAAIVATDPGSGTQNAATVRVVAHDVIEPVMVRYAWRSWGPAPLFNASGLPAAPFTCRVD
ncbi:9-O-acetylesterase [Bifidobacterium sp. 64T4]|uniref:sialate O-acetylesterase n=1 Tax=Bifidobacterium pongonis TaxID=2834432 RepID=UPI001C58F127|nr:sialate O-acetylesterase [Bifidobacterium pongonis]MBW3095277.1 9-O-acetylesterase [Bifidobacterium pongonis]